MGQSGYTDIYVALSQAVAAHDDRSISEVLGSLPDSGRAWLRVAQGELRKRLTRGSIEALPQLGQTIAAVVDRGISDPPGTTQAGFTPETLAVLRRAVTRLLRGEENETDVTDLLGLTGSDLAPTLRWSAWVWVAVARAGHGDAKTAADTALTLSANLDPFARGVSLALRGAVDLARGLIDAGEEALVQSASAFEAVGHQREASACLLALARLSIALGLERCALRAAVAAIEADPEWPPPTVFLCRRALLAGQATEAARILTPLYESSRRAGRVAREMHLVQGVEEDRLSRGVVAEYLSLRERPLRPEDEEYLLAFFREEYPDQHLLRATLAWDLLEEGRMAAAAPHFVDLSAIQDLDPVAAELVAAGREALADPPARRHVIAPVDLLYERLPDTHRVSSSAQAPESFWCRRALMAADTRRAQEILDFADDSGTAGAEIRRERRLLGQITAGRIPLATVSDYFWIRERTLSGHVAEQITAVARDAERLPALQEVIAWDLALDRCLVEAKRVFETLQGNPIDDQQAVSVRAGLEYVQQNWSRGRQLERPIRERATGEIDPNDPGLLRYVSNRQSWPSILDHHSLLFVAESAHLLDRIASAGETAHFSADQCIHSQGREGEVLYCLLSGEATAFRARDDALVEIGSLSVGQFFGEVGTLFGLPNTATVIASQPCTVFHVTRRVLRKQLKASGDSLTMLAELRQWYLRTVTYVSPLAGEVDFNSLVSQRGGWVTFQEGEQLAKSGQSARLLLIVSGVARVAMMGNHQAVQLGYLCPGDLVGELEPSPVTVTAASAISAVEIDREAVENLPSPTKEAMDGRVRECIRAAAAARTWLSEQADARSKR